MSLYYVYTMNNQVIIYASYIQGRIQDLWKGGARVRTIKRGLWGPPSEKIEK